MFISRDSVFRCRSGLTTQRKYTSLSFYFFSIYVWYFPTCIKAVKILQELAESEPIVHLKHQREGRTYLNKTELQMISRVSTKQVAIVGRKPLRN